MQIKCVGWPCPATFIFLLFETPIETLCLLAPRNAWCGNACFGDKRIQSTELNIVNGSFCKYARWLLRWCYISSLHSADESQEGRDSCPLLKSCFIGSCHVGVSKRLSRSISLAIDCLILHMFLADRSSCRSYVGSVYRIRSLAVFGFSYHNARLVWRIENMWEKKQFKQSFVVRMESSH